MSSTLDAVSPNAVSSADRSIWRSRLGSLLGFAPLGVWTVNHLWDNLAAFRGPEAWQEAVTEHASPVAQGLTMAVVLLPLLAHTVWGVGRLFTARPNAVRYPTYANWKYVLQRLSAVGLLLFIGAHLWLAFVHPRVVEGRPEAFSDISAHMRHHPPTLVVYLLGIAGISYHLANGLTSLLFRFGVVSGRRSERAVERAAWAFFLLLLVMGMAAIYALWDAGARYPAPET